MYNEEHGVTFGRYHSWRDWHLIPSSCPVITPAKERTNYVTVPGMDGAWDFSQTVAGKPVYDDREGSLEFYVDTGWWSWNTAYTAILNALAGKRMDVILDDDPAHCYHGACWLDQWKSSKSNSTITIKYRFEPYRRDLNGGADWLWDALSFEDGVIRQRVQITIDGTYILPKPVIGSKQITGISVMVHETVIEMFLEGSDLTHKGNADLYDRTIGTDSVWITIPLKEDYSYTVSFQGTGTLWIRCEGGRIL